MAGERESISLAFQTRPSAPLSDDFLPLAPSLPGRHPRSSSETFRSDSAISFWHPSLPTKGRFQNSTVGLVPLRSSALALSPHSL
ncbi:hypothetical protein ACLOJK_018567 [Asimina triloba]